MRIVHENKGTHRSSALGKAWLLGSALLVPLGAVAAGWSQPVSITGYYVWDNGAAHLRTTANQNPDGCTSAHFLTIDQTQSNFKSIWAQIISAHAQDLTVSLYYEGCIGPHPKIRAIAVPNAW